MIRNIYRRLFVFSVIAIMAALGFASGAGADSVSIERVDRECVVGESLLLVVKIELDEEKEIDVSDAKLNGKALPYQVRESSSSSFSLMVNGKMIRSSSGVEKNVIFEIPAEREGTLTLPPFNIIVGETTYRVNEMTFQVRPRPTSDKLIFKTEIVNAQPYYYPTQVIEIRSMILYRDLTGSPSIENIRLPFLKERALSLIPEKRPTFEAPINNERTGVAHETGEKTYKGKRYGLFQFKMKFRLMAPGRFQFDNHIKMQVETGRGRRRTGFFGSYRRETKAMYAASEPLKLHVKRLPEENAPPSFTGAIGDFNIKTTPDRTDVKVGDPITLSVEISGRGTWEFVKAPPLHKFPEFTDYFLLSDDPAAGEVSEDQTRKTFLLRLRVKSKTAKEIPPIPFSFFNLVTQKYVTIHSEPTPLKVFDATSRAEIVDYGKKPEETPGEKPEPPAEKAPPEGEAGLPEPLPEPEAPELIRIADNVPEVHLRENHAP
ncbi:MAG: protein BatD, partial [Desulfobacterales bacterium]|nr:protein BatD [Desulfobacterales bacterium]